MKKQTVLIIWSSIILLIVATFCGIYLKSKIDEANRLKSRVVLDCVPADIERYAVKADGTEYTLVRKNDAWLLEDNPSAVLNNENVEKLINSASKISANGLLTKKDLKEFTAENVKEVLITFADGKEMNLSFIGENSDVSALKIKGQKEVYNVYTATRDILTPTIELLRDFDLFGDVLVDDTAIDYYEYTDSDGVSMYIRAKTPNELSKSRINHYVMTRPYSSSVDDERFEQDILVKLYGLKVNKFVEDNPNNLELYGLDEKSRAKLTISIKGKSATLYIGKNDGAMIYVQRSDAPNVVAVDSTLLEILDIEPFYLLEGGLLKADTDKVRGFSIRKLAEDEYRITKQQNVGGYEYQINGSGLSQEAFNKIIHALDSVKVMRELDETPKNSKEIIINVFYTTGQANQTIMLSEINDKAYAAFVNNKAEFAVEKETVDSLMQLIRDTAANPAKMTNGGEQ